MVSSLSPIKKSYIAGFLDGDGSVYARAKPNPTYKYGFQIALYIVLFQSAKSRVAFEEVCAIIGYGKMRERKDGILEYTINKIDDIAKFLKDIRPFVILKKKQVELMIAIIESKENVASADDFQKLLQMIDLYRNLNYSKKRKMLILTP